MTPALSTMDATILTPDEAARFAVESRIVVMKTTIENGTWCRRPFILTAGPNGLSDTRLPEQAGERDDDQV